MAEPARDWSVRRLLDWTRRFFERKGVEEPRLSAETLLAHALGCERLELYLRLDRAPTPAERDRFRDLVRRRGAQEPLAYLTGRAPFLGFEFEVGPAVLVPRPETEMLVERAVADLRPHREPAAESPGGRHGPSQTEPSATPTAVLPPAPAASATPPAEFVVVDLCTGSGCIACSLARLLPQARVTATDVSAEALAIAAVNARRLGVADRVRFLQGDLFAALPADHPKADYLLANPPYIPDDKIDRLDPTVRDFEPRHALAGGPDGLAVIRRIVAGAPRLLKPGGRIAVEIGHDQGEAAAALSESVGGASEISILRDFQGQSRVLYVRYMKQA
jgi:release factor glutamine methyltransferase